VSVVPPSGEQCRISAGGYQAVVTECGGGLRLLEYDGHPLVSGYGEDTHAPSGRGQLLLPWPNRLEDGAYTFDGQDLQLPLSEPERHNAIHGLTRWTSWTLEERTDQSVSLMYRLMAQKGYPWTVDLHVLYDLSADGLTVTVTATNLADSPAPYAQGAHPYLTVGEGTEQDRVDGWELSLPADTHLRTNDRKIPVGRQPVEETPFDFREPHAIGDLELDDGFTGLSRDSEGRAEVTLSNPASGRGLVLWMDRAHEFVQVYTGNDLPSRARQSLAVEPMTAPANAFRSGDGLVVLASAGSAGDEHSSSWGIRAL
jgi:aldose 1-epimerase